MGRGTEHSVAALFSAVAAEYDATGTDYFRALGRRLVELAEQSPDTRVLDVGTGRGAVLGPAAAAVERPGQVAGVDIPGEMARLTAAELRAWPHAAVVVGDAADPPLAGPFDAVLGGMVAQFLPEPEQALRTWASLTRQGGRLGLSWWAGEDQCWVDVNAVAARHVGRGPRCRRPFSGDVPATEAVVHTAGWRDVATVVEEQTAVFADAEAW